MVRIWCVPVTELDHQHLLGEHVELHIIWNVLTQGKKGYRNHPQTKRFTEKLGSLLQRHFEQANEMVMRGYNHRSPLDTGGLLSSPYVYTAEEYKRDHAELLRRQTKGEVKP